MLTTQRTTSPSPTERMVSTSPRVVTVAEPEPNAGCALRSASARRCRVSVELPWPVCTETAYRPQPSGMGSHGSARSEEHTSELQSRQYLVCRLLLEKKKIRSSL